MHIFRDKQHHLIFTLTIICILATLISLIVQLLIFLGYPLGELVLGGNYIIAPLSRRAFHLFFVIVWGIVIYGYLSFGEIISVYSKKISTCIVVVNTLFNSYAIVWNFFLTSSVKERLIMGPLTLIVTICSIVLIIIKKQSSKCLLTKS